MKPNDPKTSDAEPKPGIGRLGAAPLLGGFMEQTQSSDSDHQQPSSEQSGEESKQSDLEILRAELAELARSARQIQADRIACRAMSVR